MLLKYIKIGIHIAVMSQLIGLLKLIVDIKNCILTVNYTEHRL